jgi:hypothetical protein
MNIQLLSLVLSLLGVSLCSEPSDWSSIDESNIPSQDMGIENSQRSLEENLSHHSIGPLYGPAFAESNILSRKKYIQAFNDIRSRSLDRLSSLFTFSPGDFNWIDPDRDVLARNTCEEMSAIYEELYFETCENDSLNRNFIDFGSQFSTKIDFLFDNLRDQIPVLKFLFDSFDLHHNFWIFFWVTHCKSDFESDFPAYQTLLFKDREFSGSFKIKTGLVLYQITLKIQSYIEKLDALSLESDFARISYIKFKLMNHLGRFAKYQNRFPIKPI